MRRPYRFFLSRGGGVATSARAVWVCSLQLCVRCSGAFGCLRYLQASSDSLGLGLGLAGPGSLACACSKRQQIRGLSKRGSLLHPWIRKTGSWVPGSHENCQPTLRLGRRRALQSKLQARLEQPQTWSTWPFHAGRRLRKLLLQLQSMPSQGLPVGQSPVQDVRLVNTPHQKDS